MKGLYKYPQAEYPYARLVEENHRRGVTQPEFELEDCGVFDENRYWDVIVEYAKKGPNDVLIRVTVCNRGLDACCLHLLPTFWYRNTWIWGCTHEGCTRKPLMKQVSVVCVCVCVCARAPCVGASICLCEQSLQGV